MTDLRAEIEEAHFRAKLFDAAMGEDYERLDALEASFNAYIPPRWSSATPRTGGASAGSHFHSSDDPSQMTDEQYSEWIRKGMWARSHRAEVEEQERRAKEREAQKVRAREARRQVEQEEKEYENRREAKRLEKARRAKEEAWTSYRALWDILSGVAALLNAAVASNEAKGTSSARRQDSVDAMLASRPPLTFRELPWPTHPPPKQPDDITKEGISSFLFASHHSVNKSRKQRIREALLAYHPDRYVGRYLSAIDVSHRTLVQEAVVRVTTMLNALMEEAANPK
jgi:hypothetical protein